MGCGGRVWAWEASSAGTLDTLERKRLHVKQSIDHVLNTLKAHSPSDSHSLTLADSRRQPSSLEQTSPFCEYTTYPTKHNNETASNDKLAPRRPSLPHSYNEVPVPCTLPAQDRTLNLNHHAHLLLLANSALCTCCGICSEKRMVRSALVQQSRIATYPLPFSCYPIGITSPHPCHHSLTNVTSV
jgi:hypothetical protein